MTEGVKDNLKDSLAKYSEKDIQKNSRRKNAIGHCRRI